jgi:hypothetical protein
MDVVVSTSCASSGVVRFPTGMSRQSVVYAGPQYLTLSG